MKVWLAHPSNKRIITISVGIALSLVGAFGARVWWNVRNAIARGQRAAASAGQVAVLNRPLSRIGSPFQTIFPAAEFRSAALFERNLFVASRSALTRFSEGELKQRWQVGQDLPPFPLSSLAVRTGIATPELWVATEGGGVVIYNGSTLRQMLPVELPLRTITAILPLRNSRVALGTGAGLYLSDGNNWRLIHPQFAHAEVTALAGDEDQIWIGTRRDGAWIWRGGEAVHLDNLPDPQILSICARGNMAWIGTPVGIAEFTAGKYSRHLADGVFARALAEDRGSLWVGTIDEGTLKIPLSTHLPPPRQSGLEQLEANTNVFINIPNDLLAITPRHILEPSNEGREILSASATDLESGHITAIHRGADRRLWVGYFDRGLDLIDLSDHAERRHIEDDTLFCINRIKEDPQTSTVAVGTANGLALFDSNGELRQILDRKAGLISSHITDILFPAESRTKRSLVIATPGGLSFLDDNGISSIYAFQGLVNNHVYTLAEMNGALYAGTLGGFSAVKNGLVQASFTTANSQLKQNWITSSAVFDGELYLGTYGSGVVEVRGAEVRSAEGFEGRIEINANAMVATGQALYAGTAGHGLAILRRGEKRWRIVSEGLPSADVTALEAQDGELYIGTENGLAHASERELLR